MPDMNLMPEGYAFGSGAKKDYIKISASLLVVVFIVYLLVIGYKTMLNKQILETEDEINSVSLQIKAGLGDRTANLVKKVEKIKEIMDSRVYWTQVFSQIEDNTLQASEFASFSGQASERKISLNGNFINYTELAKQISVFENSFANVMFSLGGDGGQNQSQNQGQDQDQDQAPSGISALINLEF